MVCFTGKMSMKAFPMIYFIAWRRWRLYVGMVCTAENLFYIAFIPIQDLWQVFVCRMIFGCLPTMSLIGAMPVIQVSFICVKSQIVSERQLLQPILRKSLILGHRKRQVDYIVSLLPKDTIRIPSIIYLPFMWPVRISICWKAIVGLPISLLSLNWKFNMFRIIIFHFFL